MSDSSVTVSVVIPAYNAEAYLGDALRSVFAQTGVSLEVIVVDDGSTDASPTLLRSLQQSYRGLTVVRQENSGQGAARNRGVRWASGAFVYFMDADDELASPDALSRAVAVAQRDNLDVLLFDAETRRDAAVVADESAVRASYYIRRHDYTAVRTGAQMMADLARHGELCVSPCLMLLRKSFLVENALCFPESRVFYEDNVFMTHVLLSALRVAHRNWRLYLRKIHSGSTVTAKPSVRHLRGYIACCLDAQYLLSSQRIPPCCLAVMRDRVGVYRHYARRLVSRYPELATMTADWTPAELAALRSLDDYPLSEKFATALRCYRDRGLVYTVGRVFSRLFPSRRCPHESS